MGLSSGGEGGRGGQIYLEDTAWSLESSRTAAMGRFWGGKRTPGAAEGLRASSGPNGSATSEGQLAHPRFYPLLDAATAIMRFSPRVRTVRL
jgi:hypothetical protein